MNLLAKVKSVNKYDYIVSSLYKEEETEEGTITVPISDVDGTTALLTTDGTSWQLSDGSWEQIEQDLDVRIKESIYPFILSVCESIHNHFIKWCMTKCYENALLSYKEENNKSIVKISNLEDGHVFQIEDFIIIHNKVNTYLTQVLDTETTNIEVENTGVNIRIYGEPECVCLKFVSFPQSFLSTALEMLGYDLFLREGKEKRQERLGNYTYTNFEPVNYYGDGSYPKELEETVKYWQRIFL